MKKFFSPENTDKRLSFAKTELEKEGFISVEKAENADFILLGVNPSEEELCFDVPIFAGNISRENVFDYTKDEVFATKNAYLTAEGALALAIQSSPKSLINSPVLITGYGRIGKALHKYLEAFTKDITICLRNENEKAKAESLGAKTINFSELKGCEKYSFIFNTVPHPVFNEKELMSINTDAILMDLASFPGGADNHFAEFFGVNLIIARGLPGKFSPKAAGKITAQTIIKIIREEGI